MVRKKALAAKEAVKTEEVSAEAVKEAASAKKEAEAAESENRKAAAAEKAEPAKAARGRKAAAKKTAKKAEMKTSLSVQYMGKDISEKDIIALVKKDWTAGKHKIGDIQTMDLYVKVEENTVYYVINGEETGSVAI